MDLEAIKARIRAVERLDAHEGGVDTGAGRVAVYRSAEDVPGLVAEVERLTRDCADLSEMATEIAGQRDEARAEVARLSIENAEAEGQGLCPACLRPAT